MAGQGKQTSAERRKQLAAEARAKAAAESRKRRLQVVAGGLAVALVAGGVFAGVAALTGGEDEDEVTQPASTPPPAASPEPSVDQTGVAEGKKMCQYLESGGTTAKDVGRPPETADAKGVVYATVMTTKGTIQLELDQASAPCTVNSFVHLAKKQFFDDSPCHRLLDESGLGGATGVLQCGDPTGTGTGGPGYKFADENLTGAKYDKGVIAMANSGKNTNGSQFFMMFKDSSFSPDYTPFGKILSGVEVLEEIAKGGRDPNPRDPSVDDVPRTKVKIEKVTVTSAKPNSTAKPESTEKPKA